MRTMNTEKLLKTIPIIQNQMDALLDFNVSLRWSPPPSCSKKLLIWSVQSAPRLLYFPNSEADFLFFVWQQIAVQKL